MDAVALGELIERLISIRFATSETVDSGYWRSWVKPLPWSYHMAVIACATAGRGATRAAKARAQAVQKRAPPLIPFIYSPLAGMFAGPDATLTRANPKEVPRPR